MKEKEPRFKVKKGRPRMKSPSHAYRIDQWRQHQDQPIQERVLRALKKIGVFSLLEYSEEDLKRSYHGTPAPCFGAGSIDSLHQCEKCKKEDAISEVEGFFKPNGKALGKDCFGIYCSCWILSWVNSLRKLN